MAQTRPRLEQIVFKSAKTGSHSIDTYLENAEIGSRTLAQLMGDLFDANGNFAPEEILPEFRIDQTGGTTKLQYGLTTAPRSKTLSASLMTEAPSRRAPSTMHLIW